MSPLLLRLARPDDVPQLAPIERAADRAYADHGHPEFLDGDAIPDDAAHRALADERLVVAELDGHVVGWLLLTRAGDELCIGQVSVAPDHKRRGVGTALLLDAIARARSRGAASLVLCTQTDVPWNAPWYERHGFVAVPPEHWTPAQHAITLAQREAGLDWSTRVHMRLALR